MGRRLASLGQLAPLCSGSPLIGCILQRCKKVRMLRTLSVLISYSLASFLVLYYIFCTILLRFCTLLLCFFLNVFAYFCTHFLCQFFKLRLFFRAIFQTFCNSCSPVTCPKGMLPLAGSVLSLTIELRLSCLWIHDVSVVVKQRYDEVQWMTHKPNLELQKSCRPHHHNY